MSAQAEACALHSVQSLATPGPLTAPNLRHPRSLRRVRSAGPGLLQSSARDFSREIHRGQRFDSLGRIERPFPKMD